MITKKKILIHFHTAHSNTKTHFKSLTAKNLRNRDESERFNFSQKIRTSQREVLRAAENFKGVLQTPWKLTDLQTASNSFYKQERQSLSIL